MIVNILCTMGAYPVELGDNTVNDLPRMIQGNGGIVVPFQEEGAPVRPSRLFIPASQIQGITWVIEEIAVDPLLAGSSDDPGADVSYIGEVEPGTEGGKVGENGELFIDSDS